MAATVYMNAATGEVTYSHKEAMSWYRDGNTVNLYREIDGKLKQDDNIKCWIHQIQHDRERRNPLSVSLELQLLTSCATRIQL